VITHQLATVFLIFFLSMGKDGKAKESTNPNANPKNKKKTKKKTEMAKEDISFNQTVLTVKQSLVPGLHEIQSSSPFYLGVVTSTIVQNEHECHLFKINIYRALCTFCSLPFC